MSTLAPRPVYELAGQQADPLAEEVLAVLFTDAPERESVRPGDSRRHQQWLARRPEGQTSRGWLSFAEPIATAEIKLLQERYTSALRVAFVPVHASSVTVVVQQTAVNELTIRWTLLRGDRPVSEGATVLIQGGG
jgi:hypothetical protein